MALDQAVIRIGFIQAAVTLAMNAITADRDEAAEWSAEDWARMQVLSRLLLRHRGANPELFDEFVTLTDDEVAALGRALPAVRSGPEPENP